MALAEVCGINSLLNVDNSWQNEEIIQEIEYPNFKNQNYLATPPFNNPSQFLGQLANGTDDVGKDLKINFDHGTTTLGFVYQGGIILAVDSRATGGAYIGSQTVKKVIEINKFLLGTMAGGAADCIYWDRVLTKQCRMHELRNRSRISVAAASKLMSNMIYNYKGMGLSIGTMITGWDKRGPSLYYVDSEGTRTQGKVFSVGSGSVFAYGVLDSEHREDLTDEEAYELGRRAIYHATHRDAYSGGIVRVYAMKETGWEHISDQDCKDLHYAYKAEKNDSE